MRRRLYFVLPDLASAIQTSNELLLAKIEDRHMHFLARRGMSLGNLHEANYFQKSDTVRGAEIGFVLGGVAGMLVGTWMYLTPPENVAMPLGTILIATVVGAIFCAWAGSLAGMSAPNARLKRFQGDFDDGRILLMVDVPASRVEEIQTLVHNRHPEAADHGLEPTIPAFP